MINLECEASSRPQLKSCAPAILLNEHHEAFTVKALSLLTDNRCWWGSNDAFKNLHGKRKTSVPSSLETVRFQSKCVKNIQRGTPTRTTACRLGMQKVFYSGGNLVQKKPYTEKSRWRNKHRHIANFSHNHTVSVWGCSLLRHSNAEPWYSTLALSIQSTSSTISQAAW